MTQNLERMLDDAAQRVYTLEAKNERLVNEITALKEEVERSNNFLKDAYEETDRLQSQLSQAEARSQWQDIKERQPPSHKDCLFLCSNGDVYNGRPCYGMHLPYWCANSTLVGPGTVINDTLTVTHWMPALKEPAPNNSTVRTLEADDVEAQAIREL